MALQTSGKISILDIVGEFGGSPPHAISEYYSVASGVPGSGEIRLSDFYGASFVFTATISSNQTNLNLRSFALNSGWDGSTVAEITIDSGVVVSGSAQSNSTAALTIDGSWPNGVTLINQGIIQGRGGNGGAGGDADGASATNLKAQNGSSGSAGGRALLVSTPVSIQNNGSIRGGGGGGGGGGGAAATKAYEPNEAAGGGGGGGGRSSLISSSGGAGGDAVDGDTLLDGSPGQNGTISSAGSRGSGGSGNIVNAGNGGNGGSFGSSGASGGSSSADSGSTFLTASGGSGGSAGQAVSGNSNITWTTTGTRIGPIV